MDNTRPPSSPLPEPDQPPIRPPDDAQSSGLLPLDHSGVEVAQPPEQQYADSSAGAKNNGWWSAQHAGDGPVHPPAEKWICGVRRTSLLLGLVCLVFFLGTIGASVAAGVASRTPSQTERDYSALKESISSSHHAPNPTPSVMNSIPIPQEATSGNGEAIPNCPDLDPRNRTYVVPGIGLRVQRECGTNYRDGDLGRIPLTRMEDCLNLCAALRVSVQSSKGWCMGVAWKTAGKQGESKNGTDENYCWLKHRKNSGINDPNVEAAWITD